LAAVFVLASIERDPKNVAFLGLSPERLAILVLSLLAALACLGAAILVLRQPHRSAAILDHLTQKPVLRRAVYIALGALALLGWLALVSPPYLLMEWKDFFIRLRPIPIAAGALAFQLLLWAALALPPGKRSRLLAFLAENQAFTRSCAWILAGLLALWGFISLSGVGLTPDDRFWNVPGMPITGFQFFAALLLLVALVLTRPPRLSRRWIDALACLVLFLTAGLLWNATNLKQHHFLPFRVGPDHQPYPASDALVYDASAHYFINGYGIFSSGYTDKPLYIVFLGLLHLLAGENYEMIIFLQVWVLALIPPLIYLIGRSMHSPPMGFFLAVLLIFRQRNAIAGSHLIASANAKLLVTEVPMLLGLLVCAWILFKWWKSSSRSAVLPALAGGIIGVISLIRLNAILLLPAAAIFALLLYRRQARLWWKHIAQLTLAFLLVFTPVVLTGTGPDGVPLLVFKFMEVIRTRYLPGASLQMSPAQSAAPGGFAALPLPTADIPPTQFVPAHFFHNMVGTVLALPNSLIYDNLETMAKRPYWVEGGDWTGQLPAGQIAGVAINLALIAVGLARSWNAHRWAGFAPLLIFLMYNLALSLGRTSGSRYLVPIDWVGYLYFAIGIVEVLRLLGSVLFSRTLSLSPTPVASFAPHRRAEWWVLLPFALLGLGMHLIDDTLPPRFQQQDALDQTALVQSYLPDPSASAQALTIYGGQALYPRFAGEKTDQPYLDFYVLSPEWGLVNARLVQVNNQQGFPAGTYAIVAGCPRVIPESAGKIFLETRLLILMRGSAPDQVLFSEPLPEWWDCR